MKFAVLYSKKDQAGINIAEQLKHFFLPHVPILELSKDSIYSEDIDEKEEQLRKVDFIIFATKHASKAGKKSLSLHAPGNWRNADFGGKPGKVCSTSSLALKFLFEKLNENALKDNWEHEITLECTHHGPLITRPCCFIEVGSSEEGWKDKEAAKIIAKTIADFQNFDGWKNESKEKNKKIKTAIAIGGPHYCPNFNKIQLSNLSNLAISHIIPEYHLPLSESMLQESIIKTHEHVTTAIIDWKGCGNSESRQKIIELCEKHSLQVLRTDQIDK